MSSSSTLLTGNQQATTRWYAPIRLPLASMTLALCAPAAAAPLLFDGGGLDPTWTNALNWEPNVRPGPGDDVDTGGFSTVLDQSFTVNSFAIGTGGSVSLAAARQLIVSADSHIDGRLVLADDQPSADFSNFARLIVAGGPVALTGNGAVEFATGFSNRIDASGGGSLVIGDDLTIRTTGTDSVGLITPALTNHGLISAFAGDISLLNAAQVNTGTLHASNGGTLTLGGNVDLDNTTGNIDIGAGGRVEIGDRGTIRGGLIGGDGTLALLGQATIDGLGMQINGLRIEVQEGDRLEFATSLANNSTIMLEDRNPGATFGNFAQLTLAAGNLDGNGEIHFLTEHQNRVASKGLAVLTPGQSIRTVGLGSQGEISANLENNGLISTIGGGLTLNLQDKINNNIIDAASAATVDVTGISIDQRGGGLIRVDGTSTLNLNDGAIVMGGQILGGGQVNVDQLVRISDGASLDNVTVTLNQSDLLRVSDGLTNNAAIVLADDNPGDLSGNFATLQLVGGAVTGTGEIQFASANQNRLDSIGETTLGSNQLVRTVGAGSVGTIRAQLVNDGRIETDGGQIDLTSAAKVNRNLISATNGAALRIVGATVEQTASGRIHVDATSTLHLTDGSTLRGGVIDGGAPVTQTGLVKLEGGADGLTLNGMTFTTRQGQAINMRGNITNNGTFRLLDTDPRGEFGNFSRLSSVDVVTIDGTGEIEFASAHDNQLIGTGFNLGRGQTLRSDVGTKGVLLTNVETHGTVLANGLITNARLLHNAVGGVVTGTGTLDVRGTFMSDGQLTAGLTVANSIGALTLAGASVDTSADSSLLIEIAGGGGLANAGISNDLLIAETAFELAGTLLVDLLAGFMPTAADEFFVVRSALFRGVVDDFLNVTGGIGTFGFGTAGVEIRGNHLVIADLQLTARNVSEPGGLLLLIGAAALMLVRRQAAARRR